MRGATAAFTSPRRSACGLSSRIHWRRSAESFRERMSVISSAARHRKRVVFASTSEVYGKNSAGSLHEDSDRILGSAYKSRWSYAIAKSYGEAIAYGYHREHGADTVVVRLFNTIGPRQLGTTGWSCHGSSGRRSPGTTSRCTATAARSGAFSTSRMRCGRSWRSPTTTARPGALSTSATPSRSRFSHSRSDHPAHRLALPDRLRRLRAGLRRGLRGTGAAHAGHHRGA